MAETPKAPATTSPVDFIVPNQHLFEQVIDARLAAHAAAEKKPSTRTSTTSTPAKSADKDSDKS